MPGRPALFWAAAETGKTWTESERAVLALAARLLSDQPALAELRERLLTEAKVRQRLDDAAFVCGRLAHDLDNLWTGILGFADLTLAQLKPGVTAHKYVSEIAGIGQRGVHVTQQLHQFSQSGACKPMPASVRAAVEKEKVRQTKVPRNVAAWKLELADDLPAVAIEANPLQLLLGQVIDNAMEADSSGAIVVAARRRTVVPEDLKGFSGAPQAGPCVEVTVTDHGGGIKEDLLPRLLTEPFVTTKVRHRGLGLVIACRIIRAHRGGIRLESKLGSGTTARLLLPIAATEK